MCVCVCVCVYIGGLEVLTKFAVIKETGECCGFCRTPGQVDEQPSLVFRTVLLKTDDRDVQRLEVK